MQGRPRVLSAQPYQRPCRHCGQTRSHDESWNQHMEHCERNPHQQNNQSLGNRRNSDPHVNNSHHPHHRRGSPNGGHPGLMNRESELLSSAEASHERARQPLPQLGVPLPEPPQRELPQSGASPLDPYPGRRQQSGASQSEQSRSVMNNGPQQPPPDWMLIEAARPRAIRTTNINIAQEHLADHMRHNITHGLPTNQLGLSMYWDNPAPH